MALGNTLPFLLPERSAARAQLQREQRHQFQYHQLQHQESGPEGTPSEPQAEEDGGEMQGAQEVQDRLNGTIQQLGGGEGAAAVARLVAFSRALSMLWERPWSAAIAQQVDRE